MDNRINKPPHNGLQATENSLSSLKSFVEKIKHKEERFEQDIKNHLKILAEGKYGKPAHEQIKKFRDDAREMVKSAPSDTFAQTAEKLASVFYLEYLRNSNGRPKEEVFKERHALDAVEAESLLETLTAQLEHVQDAGGRLFDGPEEELAKVVARKLKETPTTLGAIHHLVLESHKPTTNPVLKVFARAVQIYNKSFEQGG